MRGIQRLLRPFVRQVRIRDMMTAAPSAATAST